MIGQKFIALEQFNLDRLRCLDDFADGAIDDDVVLISLRRLGAAFLLRFCEGTARPS
jgi:hypothetical protein